MQGLEVLQSSDQCLVEVILESNDAYKGWYCAVLITVIMMLVSKSNAETVYASPRKLLVYPNASLSMQLCRIMQAGGPQCSLVVRI